VADGGRDRLRAGRGGSPQPRPDVVEGAPAPGGRRRPAGRPARRAGPADTPLTTPERAPVGPHRAPGGSASTRAGCRWVPSVRTRSVADHRRDRPCRGRVPPAMDIRTGRIDPLLRGQVTLSGERRIRRSPVPGSTPRSAVSCGDTENRISSSRSWTAWAAGAAGVRSTPGRCRRCVLPRAARPSPTGFPEPAPAEWTACPERVGHRVTGGARPLSAAGGVSGVPGWAVGEAAGQVARISPRRRGARGPPSTAPGAPCAAACPPRSWAAGRG
jgi:hypothetical protein